MTASTGPWPSFDVTASPLEQLLDLSHYYGSNPEFVLAGGGNTSVKLGDRLLVKASGYALATIGPEGIVELDRGALQALLREHAQHRSHTARGAVQSGGARSPR